MHAAAEDGANAWALLGRGDLFTAPRVQGKPTSLERKQEVPPRWGPEPEVPPLDG